MYTIPSLPLHTRNNYGISAEPASEAQGTPLLRSQPAEPMSAVSLTVLVSERAFSTPCTPAKRAHEAAFANLSPQGSWPGTAGEANRVPGKQLLPKRMRTDDEMPAVMDASRSEGEAPVSHTSSASPVASPNLLPAPQIPPGAKVAAGGLSMLDMAERSLSADDQVAKIHIRPFLDSTLKPGATFLNFVECLKMLITHAEIRKPSLGFWSSKRIFCEGLFRIAAACKPIDGSGRIQAERVTMRRQMKNALFEEGTPIHFINLATFVWKSDKKARMADPILATSYGSLKELGVFNQLKQINRADVMESRSSCQERLDAMRRTLAAETEANRIGSLPMHHASGARSAIERIPEPLLDFNAPSCQTYDQKAGEKVEEVLATPGMVAPAAAGMAAVIPATAAPQLLPTSASSFVFFSAPEQVTPEITRPVYRMNSVSVQRAPEASPTIGWTSRALLGLDMPSRDNPPALEQATPATTRPAPQVDSVVSTPLALEAAADIWGAEQPLLDLDFL
jgi:hypothetical protein